jgi:uncharacterized protein YciI
VDGEDMQVEYFVYGRDDRESPEAAALREELGERHWSFMDAYAERMVARGPTLTEDGLTATGSMHIADLRDAEEARAFAFEEPYYTAGVFREVMVRRWRNLLGGTMWENAVDGLDSDRFLVIGHGVSGVDAASDGLPATHSDLAAEHPYGDHRVVFGPLVSDDGSMWLGNVLAVERVDRSTVDAMLATDPFARAGLYDRLEIHLWHFGGRR